MRWLIKIGVGKLPGDFSFWLGGRAGGQQCCIPLASSLVLSLLAMAIGAVI